MKFFPRLPLFAVALLVAASLSASAQQAATTPPILPNAQLTPGDTLDVTLADIQEKGYSSKVRNVPISVKRQVYASYGIEHWEKGEYEVDHLIALSLGGSNSKKNLWPQSYKTTPWNARVKDQLEDRLLKLVRDGKVDMKTAQQEMATNWIAAYKRYVSPTPRTAKEQHRVAAGDGEPDTDTTPPTVPSSTPQSSSNVAVADGKVWVNTKSGVIWKPGSEYFGKTKTGKYMSAADALAAGYHYAGGKSN